MKPRTRTLSPTAVDRDGICAAQTLVGAGSLTLDGALVSSSIVTPDVPCHVSIYSGGDLSAVTFTITGTDWYNDALTEDVTGPNTTTVYSTYNFKTITGVTADAAVGTNVEVGIAGAFETAWFPIEFRYGQTVNRVKLYDTPSMTVEVQYIQENPFSATFNDYTCDYIGTGTFKVSNTVTVPTSARAVRLQVTGFTSGDIDWTVFCNG